MTVQLRLKIYAGGRQIGTRDLHQDMIRLGREGDVRLEDAGAASLHAVIEAASEAAMAIVDLDSSSGTLLNGVSITKSKLDFGDRIRIGDVEILIERPTDDALPTKFNVVPLDWKLGQ